MVLVEEVTEVMVLGLEPMDVVPVLRQLVDQRVVKVGHHGPDGLWF